MTPFATAFVAAAVCLLWWLVSGRTPFLVIARAALFADAAITLLFEVLGSTARTFCAQVGARYEASRYAEAPLIPAARGEEG